MDVKKHIMTAWELSLGNAIPLIISTILLAAVSFISLGILAPVAFAGYTGSIFQLISTGREPKPQDIFSQMRLFFPLLIFTIVILIVSLIGFTLFVLPGIAFMLIVGYTCIYMLPLMVDRQFGLIDAIKKSTAIVTTAPVVDHVVVFLLFYALTTIGGGSLIGFLILQPFATLFLLSAYRDIN